MDKDSPILFVDKFSNHIYRYAGDEKYRDLTTGKAMRIKDETIKSHAKYSIVLNLMAAKNPMICELIKILNLEYEGCSHGTDEQLKESLKE